MCREKPRRQIHLKYNNWELEGEAGTWFDLEHTDAPHDCGADWWWVPCCLAARRAGLPLEGCRSTCRSGVTPVPCNLGRVCAQLTGMWALLCRRVVVRVPEDAFEMNYVFTDGEGASDNNQGKNYLTAVRGTMTPEAWAELAIDRQVGGAITWTDHAVQLA